MRLHVKQRRALFVAEPVRQHEEPDAEFVRQMEIAERLSDEHEEAFRELAQQ